MLTRRQFLAAAIGLALYGCGDMLNHRVMRTASYPFWSIPGAAQSDLDLAGLYAAAAFTVVEGGVVKEQGLLPAGALYDALWTRDYALALWNNPGLMTAAQRRQFVTYTLSKRTTGAEADPDGGTLPANWICDRMGPDGVPVFKNAGMSKLPFMDGIGYLVVALWSDWFVTRDTATFTANQADIDTCLATLPRSASGCVWSDPAAPSVDYGLVDTVKKTGDCAAGTALLALAYKMLAEIAGEGGSGTYSTARTGAEAGLATLRRPNGFYSGSSGNNAAMDDVWATALIVAEGLVSGADRLASAQALADAYSGGTITQNGLVRNLPTGQYWAGTPTTPDTYQNGGYSAAPLWDCVRAVALVDKGLARQWATEAMTEIHNEVVASPTTAPYEWRNGAVLSTPKSNLVNASVVHRFV